MPLTSSEWHTRFTQQTRWTQDLRRYLYARTGLPSAQRILEVGVGTGALLPELTSNTNTQVIGLDINRIFISYAQENNPSTTLLQGDAHYLPFSGHTFDLCLCHFLLLWVANPFQVIKEMIRLTRPGGVVLAIAEPDYGGRIDYPPELEVLGSLQEASLRRQGADTRLGRRLAAIFYQAGLKSVEYGVLGGQWAAFPSMAEWQVEWRVLHADLDELSNVPSALPSSLDLDTLADIDQQAVLRGERVLFVPTFYAWGKV